MISNVPEVEKYIYFFLRDERAEEREKREEGEPQDGREEMEGGEGLRQALTCFNFWHVNVVIGDCGNKPFIFIDTGGKGP